jgi:deazaflavin-dependent oxidoreductase (nitroreductase family)
MPRSREDLPAAGQHAVRWFAATGPGSWVFARALHHLDRVAFRASRHRWTVTSAASGLPVVMLTTRGARTGTPRTVPLIGFPTPAGIAVAAGGFGSPREPAWAGNLRAHPRATLATANGSATSVQGVVAEELRGSDRERVWAAAIKTYAGAAAYQRRAHPREIAVFVLLPADTD